MATPEIKPEDYEVVVDGETLFISRGYKRIYNTVLVQNSGCIELETSASVEFDVLTLNGNAVIDASEGIASFGKIKVYGVGNELIGSNVPLRGSSKIIIDEDAVLTMDKENYDSYIKRSVFESKGRIYVTPCVGNELTNNDIQRALNHTELRDVVFMQNLDELQSLTIKDDKKVSIGFQNAYGTKKNDSIKFGKNAEVDFGSSGYEIDLLEGNNTITFGSNASGGILADLVNISSITINDGVMKKDGESSIKVQGYTQVHFGSLTFSDERNSTLKINKFALISLNSITGDAKRTNSISVGSNSELTVTGSVSNVSKFSVAAGSKYREYSDDSKKVQGISKTVINGTVTGSVKADSYSFGNYTRNTLRDVEMGAGNDTFSVGNDSITVLGNFAAGLGNDSFKVGNYSTATMGNVEMGLGNDTFTLGSCSSFTAAKMNFGEGSGKEKDSFTIGATTTAAMDEISGINKFTVNAGKSKYDMTVVNVYGNVTGTQNADTFAFGNNTNVNIGGVIDFAAGKNKLTVGTYSTVVLKADADSAALINTFTLGKYSTGYFSTEVKAQFDKKNAASKQAKDKLTICDIGEAEVAVNFTDMTEELADNTLIGAHEWEGKGWLSSLDAKAEDLCDFVEVGEYTLLSVEESEDFRVTAYYSGDELSFTDNTVDLTAYAGDVLKIELVTDGKAVSYQLLA